jgi:hypothetical protein
MSFHVNSSELRAFFSEGLITEGTNMKLSNLGAAAAMVVLVTACDGDNGNGSMPTSYNFVTPTANAQRNYQETIIDNVGNTIVETYSQTVTTVNSDGSYVVLQEDTTGNAIIEDGTTYTIPTETINVNNSGQQTMYSFTNTSGATEVCTYSPHGPSPDFPITVGQTWTLQYTLTCGSAAAVSHTQTGTVVDVESVTVPAGTYNALKLQSTDTSTNAKGTTITQTTTNWRDVVTGFSVQRTSTRAYSGTLPTTGYAVSISLALESTN